VGFNSGFKGLNLWRKIDSILTHPVCDCSLTGIAVDSEWARSATGEKERKKERKKESKKKKAKQNIPLCGLLCV
jgi:hypothetical protein